MEIRDDFMICHPKLGLNRQKGASYLMMKLGNLSGWMGSKNILTSYRIKHSLKGNGFEYRHDYLKPHIERHERLCVITIT